MEKQNNDSMEIGMTDYITTYTGIHFIPTQPEADGVEIKDIAHALSYICRGNGHLKSFFSVGQHCIYCSREAEARGYSDRVILGCLLHDASEAYLSDVPRPFKKRLPQYHEWEEALLQVIYTKYLGSDLTEEEKKLIKQIDDDLLFYDLKELLNEPQDGNEPVLHVKIEREYVPFEEVEKQYLERFRQYLDK